MKQLELIQEHTLGGAHLPLYEYRCTSCGYSFEKIQSFSAQPERECPKCHGILIRPVTAPALRFEGAGWYVNDYAGKGGAKSGEAAQAGSDAPGNKDSKTEAKTETKSETKAGDSGATSAPAAATAAPASTPAANSTSSS